MDTPSSATSANTLKLISFNIQAGTSTTNYRHYVTRGWRQVLPHGQRVENLDAVSELVADYDICALQEVDSGSLRSGFIHQTKYLANHAGFPWWYHQANRKVGALAYAGNGFLSRYEPTEVFDHRLPGTIPGRGALLFRFGDGEETLVIAVLHLALGRRARSRQLAYIADLITGVPNCIVMGDFNTPASSAEVQWFMQQAKLSLTGEHATYPSWQPQRAIDYVLTSQSVRCLSSAVMEVSYSDHCPVVCELELPAAVQLSGVQHAPISVQITE